MKFSSSFKVGILTLSALILLVGAVLKVKGRAFSSAKRIEIQFKDGLRAKGWNEEQLNEIWDLMLKQAEYSFNAGHATAYG